MRIESFLQQSPIFQANRIARRMDASLTLALSGEELSVFESLVLAAIFFEKRGAIKPSDLAEAFQTTRGNVSHCISSLEAKRLVERRLNPDDARALQLLLTAAGKTKSRPRRRHPRPHATADRRGGRRGFVASHVAPDERHRGPMSKSRDYSRITFTNTPSGSVAPPSR